MNIVEIISKKRDKQELTKEEIDFVINGLLDSTIKDYQISSLLMAIVLNGMSEEEIFSLTDAMINSGDKIDLSGIDGIIVDKHSTGGVGDKVTLVLAPLLASFDIKIAKMSGRGLGHTGGTIDKLEAISGYQTELNREDFIKQVNDINIAVISQSGNLAPADKKLYALRDVTGTVESIPLIASSIMSKKIASGADLFIIDVKVGNGALMKNILDARLLAKTMINIGKRYNKATICVLTNMDEPLGFAVGNSLEVKEAMDTLQGLGPNDLLELVIKLASIVISSIKKISIEEAESACFKQLNNGNAFNKFKELVSAQHGNLNEIEISNRVFSVRSTKSGYINHINTLEIGNLARQIGAGRFTQEDKINYKVGIVLTHKIGDYVNINDELVKVYLDQVDLKINDILGCFDIGENKEAKNPLIYEIIN